MDLPLLLAVFWYSYRGSPDQDGFIWFPAIGDGVLGDASAAGLTDFSWFKTGNVKFARRFGGDLGGCLALRELHSTQPAFTANPLHAV